MLDVETTGLDTANDEIIELAMVKFAYLPDDRIARITDVFSSFNEPQDPIPAEITDLTGIADEHCVSRNSQCIRRIFSPPRATISLIHCYGRVRPVNARGDQFGSPLVVRPVLGNN